MSKILNRRKTINPDGSIEDLIVWDVPVSGKYPDGVRYRMVYVARKGQRPAVLYDNHYPKGHHKHIGKNEMPYVYQDIDKLTMDFQHDVAEAKRENI